MKRLFQFKTYNKYYYAKCNHEITFSLGKVKYIYKIVPPPWILFGSLFGFFIK